MLSEEHGSPEARDGCEDPKQTAGSRRDASKYEQNRQDALDRGNGQLLLLPGTTGIANGRGWCASSTASYPATSSDSSGWSTTAKSRAARVFCVTVLTVCCCICNADGTLCIIDVIF